MIMVKKLQIVRVDADFVEKIELHVGDNIIGSGIATGSENKQISKHAVTIHVSPNGEMTISPHQVRPCLMKSAGSSRFERLELGSNAPIHPGDTFALLTDDSRFWFKIISVDDKMADNDPSIKRKAETPVEEQPPDKKVCPESSVEALLPPNENLNNIPSSVEINPTDEKLNASDSEEANGTVTDHSVPPDIYGASMAEETSEIPSHAFDNESWSTETIQPQTRSPSSPSKRDAESLSTIDGENNDVGNEESSKKIKWDCGQHFSDRNDQESSSTQNMQSSTEALVEQQVPIRNKCIYGSRCYRKNAEHRTEFSHPGDSDYQTPDNRPECRFGIKCYRKNPQHKKDYKHTAKRPRRAQTPIRTTTPDTTLWTDLSSAEESVDESDYDPSCCSESSDDECTNKSDWDDK